MKFADDLNIRSIKIDDREVSVSANIAEVLEINGITIVRLRLDDELYALSAEQIERNVLAFDGKGQLLWQIQASPIRPYDENTYSGMGIEKGEVIVYNTCGYEFLVNTADGSVTKSPPWPTRPW